MTQSLRAGQQKPAGSRISYEEFLDRYDGTRAEWADGEVILMSPVSRQHQQVTSFLFRLLAEIAEAGGLGTVFRETFQMKTGPDLPGHEPDIIFVATEHEDRIHENHIAGPGDLVIEVVSPESLVRDRAEKFQEYESGGVREYWIIDPERRFAEFFVRGADGLFHPAQPGDDGVYQSSALPGLRLNVAWLWERPPLREILGEMELR